MAVCLEYQSVYSRGSPRVVSLRAQLAAGVLLICALAFKVWIKIESVDLGYQLAREREVALALDMERRELELQRSVLLRPDTLAQSAYQRLGLRHIDANSLVRVEY